MTAASPQYLPEPAHPLASLPFLLASILTASSNGMQLQQHEQLQHYSLSSLCVPALCLLFASCLCCQLLLSPTCSPLLPLLSLLLVLAVMRRSPLKLLSSTSPLSSPSSTATSPAAAESPSPHRRRRARRDGRTHPYAASSPSSQSIVKCDTASPSSSSSTSSASSSCSPLSAQSPLAGSTLRLSITSPLPTSVTLSAEAGDPLLSDFAGSFPALAFSPYTLLRTLEQSLFGCVKLASCLPASSSAAPRLVCIKISSLPAAASGLTCTGLQVLEDVRREAALLRHLAAGRQQQQASGSDGVVRLRDELEDERYHYLVLDYAGHDLFAWLKGLPMPADKQDEDEGSWDDADDSQLELVPVVAEAQARPLFRQLIRAVRFCHSRHVALNDLSLENVCLDSSGRIRLIDLGLAQLHPLSPYRSAASPSSAAPHPSALPLHLSFPVPASAPSAPLCGKCQYMSPEAFARAAYNAYSSDLYACGVILYTLLVGRPPYQQPVRDDFWYSLISSGQWTTAAVTRQGVCRRLFGSLSPEAVELLDGMLKEERRGRWDWEQIERCSWMQQQ